MKVKFPQLKSLWLSKSFLYSDSQKDLGDEALVAITDCGLPKL